MTIRRFEDLIAWQKARALAARVYDLTLSGPLSRDYAMTFQLRKAVLSIGSNIAEGFERGRLPEFHQFLSISKASCAEVRSQLYTAHDIHYIDDASFREVSALATETARVIGGLRASLRRQLDEVRETSPVYFAAEDELLIPDEAYLHDREPMKSELPQERRLTQNSGLRTQDQGLRTQDSEPVK